MTICGMLRIQNEGRWIARVVRSIALICKEVFIFDDHSTDDSAAICEREGCVVIPSPFPPVLNQGRDMQYLYDQVMARSTPDWIINLDGDEELEPGGAARLATILETADPGIAFVSLWIRYLWDRRDQIRVDGVYANFRRNRVFRAVSGAKWADGTIHYCGAGRLQIPGRALVTDLSLLHYGYLHREDRIRKYHWHNRPDVEANNQVEDCFRHIVQGDIPEVPAEARLLHAGPLTLRPFAL